MVERAEVARAGCGSGPDSLPSAPGGECARVPEEERCCGRGLFGVGFRGSGVGGDDGGGEKHSDEGDGEKKIVHCGLLVWGVVQPLT